MVTVAWHELLSWFLLIVSATLFFYERKRNDGKKYYMVLQGMLRACSKRAEFLANQIGRVAQNSQREVSREEFLLLTHSEYTDKLALMEHVMGAMKAIEPSQDAPFDVAQFLQRDRTDTTSAMGNSSEQTT
jgi:hypothetical protein